MSDPLSGLNAIPESIRPFLYVLIGLQLVAQAFALVRLWLTPEQRLVFGKRWVWLLIIIFGELIGAIVFIAVGRKPAPAADPLARGEVPVAGDRATRAADVLYGGRKDGDK